jgi:DNA-binding PadR family transcriptional regulator
MDLTWPAEYVALALLEPAPRHGYELHRAIGNDPALRSIWRVGRSELYFLLKKLEKRGWIMPHATQVTFGPPRTSYAITASGQAALRTWLASPVPTPRDLRAEFLAKVYLGRMLGAPETSGLLQSQSDVLQKRLDRLQQGAQQAGFERFVHLLRLLQTQAALQWLAELDVEATTCRTPTTELRKK